MFSLACLRSETLKMQGFFFRVCAPKGKSLSQAFLAGTVETGDKNRDVSERHLYVL